MPRSALLNLLSFATLGALLMSACMLGGSDPEVSQGERDEWFARVVGSADHLAEAESYRMRLAISEGNGDTVLEGESGHLTNNTVVYDRKVIDESMVGPDDLAETLIIGTALYSRTGDDAWYVIDPWLEAVAPLDRLDVLANRNFVEHYYTIVRALQDVRYEDDEAIDGVVHRRYTAMVLASDIDPTLWRQTADVELWLEDGVRPSRLVLKGLFKERPSAKLTFEFFDYGAEITAPAPPPDARVWEVPTAPCSGSEFLSCFEAQSDLQAIASDSCVGAGPRVCLVPLGRVQPGLMEHLIEHYQSQYGLTVTVLNPLPIPPELDSGREQVGGSSLIAYMERAVPDYADPEAILIGVTAVDIYWETSDYQFVFGVRNDRTDPMGVVSTFRMNPETFGEPADDELLFTRARKMLSKYIGYHYYGLEESLDPTSPMYGSIGGLTDLDRMEEPLPVS